MESFEDLGPRLLKWWPWVDFVWQQKSRSFFALQPSVIFWQFQTIRFVLIMIPGSEVIKLGSCWTQLSMKFFLLINVKTPTTVGILTFMNRKKYHSRLIWAWKKLNFLIFICLWAFKISCSVELSMKKFYNLGARLTFNTLTLGEWFRVAVLLFSASLLRLPQAWRDIGIRFSIHLFVHLSCHRHLWPP